MTGPAIGPMTGQPIAGNPTGSSPLRNQIAAYGQQQPNAYSPYAAGPKQYGLAGGHAPTMGPVSLEGQQGYQDRDMQNRSRRNALLGQIEARQQGNLMSSANLGGELH